MTANWDASASTGNLFASDPANIPTGTVADGEQVGAWVSTVNSDHYWRPYTSGSVFNPADIVWQDDATLTVPSIQVIAGTMEAVTEGTGAELTTDTFHSASAKTLIFSFLLEDASLLTNSGTVYLNSALVGNGKNNYFGTHLRNNGGTISLSAYNWDTEEDHVSETITVGTKYVIVITHDGVDLSMTVMTPSGENTQSIASGNTDTISGGPGRWLLADSNAAGTEQVLMRIGQITTWDTVLTGLDLSNAKTYYSDKWFYGALSGNLIRGSFVLGENGIVQARNIGFINMDAVQRSINDDPGALHLGGNFVMHEQASAPIGYTGGARLYVVDNAGKLELQVIFPTGVAQVIAAEP
jgi:hypothetical protein